MRRPSALAPSLTAPRIRTSQVTPTPPCPGPRRPLPWRAMFAHITPLETPFVWFVFAAGIALGAVATWFVMQKRAARN